MISSELIPIMTMHQDCRIANPAIQGAAIQIYKVNSFLKNKFSQQLNPETLSLIAL